MNWQYTPFVLPLFMAAGISAGLALYSWKQRPAAGATLFALLMLAVAEWALGDALRLGCINLPDKFFWARVRYLGILAVPAVWAAFALQYTGREKWLTPRNIAILAIEPLATLLLVWTNDAHHLIWSNIKLETSGSLLMWSASHGSAFWIHTAYSYLLFLLSTSLLIQTLIHSPRLYRKQAGILLIGALTPLVGNMLSTFGLISFPLDLTPFAFTIAGLTIAWGIFRFRLLDIIPVARSAVVDSMGGGVLVLDVQNHIVDINPAAQNIVGRPASEVIGQPASQILADKLDLVNRYSDVTEAHTEITLGEEKTRRSYDLRISPLYAQSGHFSGRLIVLHDITEHKRVEANLIAQKQWFENLVAMARATAKHTSLEATLQSAVNMAATLTGAEHGSMFLLDGTGVVTHSVLARGKAPTARKQDIVRDVMGDGLAGWVVRHRQPALIHDTFRDDRWLALPDTPSARSAMAIPIVSGSAVLGVLTLTHPDPNHFSTEHAYLIQASADQVMLAVRNAQMYDEQRRLANRQTTLYEVLRTVGKHLDPETIAHAAVKVVARLTDWPAIAIVLPDGATPHLVVQAGAGALSVAEGQRLPIDRGITGQAFQTAQTQHVPDVSADQDYVNGDSVFRSELAVPLQRGERVLGVLNVASDQTAIFNNDDILLAQSLAKAIALALDNARLYAEIRQYAADLADERSRLQALIESSRDGIILIGIDMRILVVNAPLLDLLHLTGQPEDWVNQSIQDALTILNSYAPDVVQAIRTEVHRIGMESESSGEGEWEIPPRTIHWLNLPVMAGTTPMGRLLVLRDVTEERSLERMRDDLIHAMVHDLRNPLTVISGSLSFLDDDIADILPPNHLELWEIAKKSTKGMLELIKAILEISRLESRQMPLEHTLVSLADLVASVLNSQLPLATEKDLHLESDVPPTLPPAWADEVLIKRVLLNLVSNAIKFTPADGVVRVTVKADIPEHSRFIVSVSDTGSGILPDIQDRIFQKFVTGRQAGHGSGLGLAFCKMVIEAHDERIWVESTSESGTTFAFTLPLPPALES